MTVATTRTRVFCSLGPIIEGNFADTYIQGAGLVTTRGTVTLHGNFRPDIGTPVEFAYQEGSTLSRLPRKLRVLSTFADPFRNITTVQLGCKLTYLEGRKPPLNNPNAKEEHAEVPCVVFQTATLNISAAFVAQQCLTALGITAASALPLTSTFAVEEFDLTPGYVQVLGDLLASECYLGYLDEREQLVVRSLTDDSGTGPVIDGSSLLSISPIGVGDLPGESVLVRYTSRRLKGPGFTSTTPGTPWDVSTYVPSPTTITDVWQNAEGETITDVYTFTEWQRSETLYDSLDRAILRTEESNGLYGVTTTITDKRYRNVPSSGTFTPCGEGVTAGETVPNFAATGPEPDYTEPVSEYTEEVGPVAAVVGACGFPDTIYPSVASIPRYSITLRTQEVFYTKDASSGITQTRTVNRVPYVFTAAGQAAIARRASTVTDLTAASAVIDAASTLVEAESSLATSKVRIRTEKEFGLERRPSQAERNAAANQREEPGERTEELEWVLGSSDSTLVTEFAIPYPPDDTLSWTEVGGFVVTPSGVAAKARAYGRVQNRLLLGNRQGISIQLPAPLLPPRPFDPLYINASTLTAQYRVNAATYTFDANGLIASCDALFWGGTGTTS